MKSKLSKRNIVFLILILLLVIPQTRQPLLILLHKGLSHINQSSLIDAGERVTINYSSWRLQSDNNISMNFDDTKGQVVFINFWATWCPPCIAEMPSLQLLYDDYKDRAVFLFVTSDNFNTVENFKTKRGFTFDVYNPLNQIPPELTTKSIPRTFIVNRKGEIVVDESGAVDWNSKTVRGQLDALINE